MACDLPYSHPGFKTNRDLENHLHPIQDYSSLRSSQQYLPARTIMVDWSQQWVLYPQSIRPVVVLPHPLSPTKPTVSPRRMEKLTPSTAFTHPTFFLKKAPSWMGKYFLSSRASSSVEEDIGIPPFTLVRLLEDTKHCGDPIPAQLAVFVGRICRV